MEESRFAPEKFFDLNSFVYKDIFQGKTAVWEVVAAIKPFLDSLFNDGRVKGNYAENVYVSPSATVDTTARIIGPAIIGENVQVQFNAYIAGNVILDNNVVIGPYTELKTAILLNTAKMSHRNFASHSILGNQARMGVGSVITDKRVDRSNIMIKVDAEKKIDTGSTRFGAIIGDWSRIGANAVINPGTIIGQRTLIYPLESVHGIHGDNEIVK
jgi:UDP-N-acetylglucosamine diphosphorylase / glucose-1-phosphate thymidylyltransferase / UDP-N-acetylgalactosamine diphosphorylase / glucosamine-1-phosphate N-acetyltransferase / galactosamine-1-phosphate N-acetyltransferase